MKRLSLVVIALALATSAATAQAMDCGAMLDKHSGDISKMTAASAEKRAALRRMAVTGYDHCMAGDVVTADKFFAMIATTANTK